MLPFDLLSNPKTAVATMYLRFFGLTKIPLLGFCRPTVLEMGPEKVVFKIPLGRRTKNHLGSMYFGALAAGADLAAGFIAMQAIRASGEPISLIFKDLKADFLKRAEGDVHFSCEEGVLVRDLVQKAIETGERVEMAVPVIATCPDKLGNEPVARFTLTLSLKRKDNNRGQSTRDAQTADVVPSPTKKSKTTSHKGS